MRAGQKGNVSVSIVAGTKRSAFFGKDLSSLALRTAGLGPFTLQTQEIDLCSLQRGRALIWRKYYEKKSVPFCHTPNICQDSRHMLRGLAGAPARGKRGTAFGFPMIQTFTNVVWVLSQGSRKGEVSVSSWDTHCR